MRGGEGEPMLDVRVRSVASRCTMFAVALSIVGAPISHARASVRSSPVVREDDDAKRFNADAQELYQGGDLGGAAEAYAAILGVLDENTVNLEERDNTLLLALETYREAYEAQRLRGTSVEQSIELLRSAVRLFDAYAAEFRAVHSGRRLSDAAQASGEETTQMLAEAEAELTPTPPPVPSGGEEEPTSDGPILRRHETFDRPDGLALIYGGSATIALGLGSIAMIAVGTHRTRTAARDHDQAVGDPTREAEADRRGRSGEALVISGAVLTGVLLAGGATMLGLGVRQRRNYMAVAPQLRKGYVGVGLGARF